MKNFILCFFVATIFLSGCSVPKSNNSDENIKKVTDEDSTNSQYIYDCEAPGYFSNLDDFYTFATTGSRDPSKYSDPYTAENVSWYPNIDSNALLKIEDLFDDEKFTEDIDEIFIPYLPNHYQYVSKGGIIVDIKYNTKHVSSHTDKVDSTVNDSVKYIEENDSNKFSLGAEKNVVYVKNINGVTVHRQVKKLGSEEIYRFTAIIDSYEINIETYWGKGGYSSHKELLEDEKNNCIYSFFIDTKLSGAIDRLKHCINSVNKK